HLGLNFALQAAGGAHHEDDHADGEDGGNQHDPAFEDILIKLDTRDGNCHGNTCHKGGYQGNVNHPAQLMAANLGQVSERDSNDEGGLYPLPQCDDESMQHTIVRISYLQIICNYNESKNMEKMSA